MKQNNTEINRRNVNILRIKGLKHFIKRKIVP